MNKIVLIGCGNVGMSYAYALTNQKINVDEVVLIDINKEKSIGEAMDLNHCLPYSLKKMVIKSGDYSDVKDAKIVVIAAGENQLVGETRMDLINKNSKIFKDIISKVMENNFNGVFLVATNPLDVMTYITYKYSGLSSNKVIGSGTSLDTARLRYLISEITEVNPKNIHAYVIGEHGDSEFVPWSNASIALQNINDFLTKEQMDKIEQEVRNAAYEIIKRKGNTSYGIGICLAKITNAILDDENSVITVSTYDEKNDIYIGVPSIINRNGIKDKVLVDLTLEEATKLQNSVDVIKKAIEKIE